MFFRAKEVAMKKILALILCLLLAVSCLACTGGKDPNIPPKPVDPPSGGKLNVFIHNQGYGRDWVDQLASKFGELTGVEVNVIANEENATGTLAIENEKSTFDLVFSGEPITHFVSAGKLQEISDVFITVPEGESKSVKQKLDEFGVGELFDFNGKNYIMPWHTMHSGINYNIKVLNSVFGENKWEEPVTTDEFIEMLNRLNEIETAKVEADPSYADTRAYGIVISPELNYWSYPVENWWAQYEGNDDFYNYFYAEYYDAGGVKNVAKDKASFAKALNATGRLEALKVLAEVLDTDNVNPVSEGLGYINHQKQFASGVFQSNKNPSAFLSCGDWLEKETYAEVKAAGEPIRLMKTPVISSIVQKLDDKQMSDETLAAVIRAIDAGAKEYKGVSADDFNRIAEARSMNKCGVVEHSVALPKNARNVDNAKAFLVFMASELGQSIFAKANGGMTQPYGYNVASDTSIVISEYVKSIIKAYGGGFTLVGADRKAPLVFAGTLDMFGGQGALDKQFWKGANPELYHNNAVKYESERYESIKMYIAPTVRK